MSDRQRADQEHELAYYRQLAGARDAAGWAEASREWQRRYDLVFESRDQLKNELLAIAFVLEAAAKAISEGNPGVVDFLDENAKRCRQTLTKAEKEEKQ